MIGVDGYMGDLKKKYEELDDPIRYGLVAGVVVIGLVLILKVIPAILGGLGIGLILILLVGPYWIPTIVAFVRQHPSKGGVLALNLLLGWTFIGWVVALVWALSDNRRSQNTVVVQNNVTMGPIANGGSAGVVPGAPVPQVGDVVGGHRFDGTSWVLLTSSGSGPLPLSDPPVSGQP